MDLIKPSQIQICIYVFAPPLAKAGLNVRQYQSTELPLHPLTINIPLAARALDYPIHHPRVQRLNIVTITAR